MIRTAPVKFQPFSHKQRQMLNWWTDASPVKDKNGLIADGAIRSGKTVCLSLSFVLWAMTHFDAQNFGMCGKTIKSFERNVLSPLARMLSARKIAYDYRRGDHILAVSYKGRNNTFYIFGGKDEASQDLVQGVTLAGVFFDEVALMPKSFVNQATARCSVNGSKYWFNCNPEGPNHWFKQEWIDKREEKDLLYIHVTLDDNLSLSEAIKERYRHQYTGVFYDRYIRGLWVLAEGIIYDMFDKAKHVKSIKEIAPHLTDVNWVSCDYGTQNPTTFLMWNKGDDKKYYCIREYYYSGRTEKKQKTDAEYAEDMLDFIGETKVRAVVVDPSAASFITALKRRDIPVIKAKNDVLNGIRETSVMLENGKLQFADTCKNTFDEFGEYIWDEKAAERGEDAPVKANDHAMDAMRYFVHTIIAKKAKIRDKAEEGLR